MLDVVLSTFTNGFILLLLRWSPTFSFLGAIMIMKFTVTYVVMSTYTAPRTYARTDRNCTGTLHLARLLLTSTLTILVEEVHTGTGVQSFTVSRKPQQSHCRESTKVTQSKERRP